jgi:hypothetical protein
MNPWESKLSPERSHSGATWRSSSRLGAYLGELLVKHLGGHWVPQRSLLEAAVVVGPRAWREFCQLGPITLRV